MVKSYDIAVVFGGRSNENEVSVITGTMVCNVLKRGGKSVLPVYITHGGEAVAGEGLADVTIYKDGGYKSFPNCAFARGGVVIYKGDKPKRQVAVGCIINCCHGGCMEGGALAGVAAAANLPFASAGVAESALFMDKYLTKLVLRSLGVNTARYVYATDIESAAEGAERLGYPVLVKPVSLGSSIGIAKAESAEEVKAAAEAALTLDKGVLVEEYIEGKREINCAAYLAGDGVKISELEEVYSSNALLTYDDKYSGGGGRKFPAEVSEKVERAVKGTTERVYTALGMRGIARFDYILKYADGGKVKIYLSEVNTVPGSLSQYLLSKSYKDFYGLLEELIEVAKRDFKKAASKKIITTGILNNLRANACKLK